MDLQQSYINGFIKRAAQYGLSQRDAVHILKQASDPGASALGAGNDRILSAGRGMFDKIKSTVGGALSGTVGAMAQNTLPGSANRSIAEGAAQGYKNLTSTPSAPVAPKAYTAPQTQGEIDARRQFASANTPSRAKAPSPDEMLAGVAAANKHINNIELARQQAPSTTPQPLAQPTPGMYAGW